MSTMVITFSPRKTSKLNTNLTTEEIKSIGVTIVNYAVKRVTIIYHAHYLAKRLLMKGKKKRYGLNSKGAVIRTAFRVVEKQDSHLFPD